MLQVKISTKTLFKFTMLLVNTLIFSYSSAKEGIWIPATLKKLEDTMKAYGLEIPVERLYNDSGTGLSTAVVLFGRGCTAEVISPKGLILTNRHCGYGSVQGLSNIEHDYVSKGFFAKNEKDEIPCPGLTVTFLRRMENVTNKILPMVNDTLHDAQRDSMLVGRIAGLEREYEIKTGLEATIKPFFDGNEYWVLLTETYRDVRLTGIPPKGIGGFGGDIENWSWPSHTGDFCMFRIYAGADNKPADYASNNQPYKAPQYFTINTSGYKEGDYTMVMGYPSTTFEYITSYELNQVCNIIYPINIEARTKKLAVLNKHIDASAEIMEKYASKRSGITGAWKKWSAELAGLQRDSALQLKKNYETGFQKWATGNIEEPYSEKLLPRMAAAAKNADNLLFQDQCIKETVLAIELIQQGSSLERFAGVFRLKLSDSALTDTLKKMATNLNWFYKNYDLTVDKDVFTAILPIYLKKCHQWLPPYYQQKYKAHKNNVQSWATEVYATSILTSQEKLMNFASTAKTADSNKILKDPAYMLFTTVTKMRKEKLTSQIEAYRAEKHYYNRLYQKARKSYEYGTDIYPDANLTLRLSFGHVKGLKPDGLNKYSFRSNLSDIMELDKPKSEFFEVTPLLKEKYQQKDFGRWAENDTLFATFIADNHTSGGNSGSPVMNSKGELIGTNYDRASEGLMSDYLFDPNRFRNISVDIRYTLFIVEKIGGAGWLIDEMNLKK